MCLISFALLGLAMVTLVAPYAVGVLVVDLCVLSFEEDYPLS